MRLIAAVALVVVTSVCQAQAPSNTTLGMWAGVTSATFRGSDAPGPTNLAGFSAAVFAQWKFAPHFFLQPELQYTQKGSDEVDVSNGGTVFTMHIRLHYIEVPVLLRAQAAPIGPFTPFAVAGPDVAFKAGCGIVVNGLPVNYTCKDLPTANSVDYGGLAGAGVGFKLAGRSYGLSARYDYGIADTFAGNNAKNRAWSILLGTVFK